MTSAWWYQAGVSFYNNEYMREAKALEDLKRADIIGIFFGAYSSRVTRTLVKYIKKFHAEIRNKTKRFQIIFCSMDDNERDCQNFVRELHGDWLVIPWGDHAAQRRIARNQCNVITYPALVILKNEGDGIVISMNGKEEMQELGMHALDRWDELARIAAKGQLELD